MARRKKAPPTDLETQEAASAAHMTAVAEAPEMQALPAHDPATDFNPEQLERQTGVSVAGADRAEGFRRERPRRTFDPKPGRPWTERYDQPVKYRRFTTRDETGQDVIMFRFDLAHGEDRPPPEVLKVMHKHQRDLNDEPTELRYNPVDRRHGKVWKLPHDPQGTTTADRIDRDLQEVAEKLSGREAGR